MLRYILLFIILTTSYALALTPDQKLLLLLGQSSCPASVLVAPNTPCPNVDVNFATGQAWVQRQGYVPLSNLASITNATGGYVTNLDGTLTYKFGPVTNILKQSSNQQSAPWALLNANGTVHQTVAAPDGSLSYSILSNTGTVGWYQSPAAYVAGTTYIISSYVQAVSGSVNVTIGSDTAIWGSGTQTASATFTPATQVFSGVGSGVISTGFTSLGGGWYRIWVVATAASTSGTGALNYNNATGTEAAFWCNQNEAITYTTQASPGPCVQTGASTASSLAQLRTGIGTGLLVEESRQNLLLQSQAIDNATWTKGGLTVTANQTAAPDGATTAEIAIPSALVEGHNFNQTPTYSVAAVSWTVYAKSAGYSFVSLSDPGQTFGADFNLSTPTATALSAGGSTASITAVGNGWYRLFVTFSGLAANTTLYTHVGVSTNGRSNAAGNGTSGVYLWGEQLEQAAFSTSYIPTTAAAVTRAADNILVAGVLAKTTLSGTLFSSYNLLAAITAARQELYDVGADAANNDRLVIRGNDIQNPALPGFAVGNGTVVGTVGGTAFTGQGRLAAAWTSSASSIANNGNAATTQASGWSGVQQSTYIGSSGGGGAYLNGSIARLTTWNSRLPDATLQKLTQ